MKRLVLLFLLVASPVYAGSVRGYWKDTNRDGVKDTYIQPYQRTNPDSNPYNNYSTKGNINPWTGKEGTVEPYKNLYQVPSIPSYQPYPYNYQNPYNYGK